MRRSHGYSTEFKKAAVEKLLTRGSRTVTDIVAEIGISSPTICKSSKLPVCSMF
jgi:hypothetical protein